MQPNPDQMLCAPTLDEVRTAADTLATVITPTPLLESPEVNARLGGRLLIKNEAMQRTGAFKFRGAYNRISQMDAVDGEVRWRVPCPTGFTHGLSMVNLPASVADRRGARACRRRY